MGDVDTVIHNLYQTFDLIGVVLNGIIGGAIVGGALASPYYYGPGYAYGPGYGPGSGTTEGQPPRSYDFRYLGDETPKPTTEAEKAEFRTTLRNWGIFALALVLVLIIVGFIL